MYLVSSKSGKERPTLFGGAGCDPSDHLQESPGPKSQKNLKKNLFGGLRKSPRKYPKKIKKYTKKSNFGNFLTFSGIFGDFFADPPKDSF